MLQCTDGSDGGDVARIPPDGERDRSSPRRCAHIQAGGGPELSDGGKAWDAGRFAELTCKRGHLGISLSREGW